jgi:predicted TIM-barrel fold metal-dependent hydrolase
MTQIIDAQIHLWATGLPSNSSHWQMTHVSAEEAMVLMDEGGVDAAVIHPPEWDPGSTELALRAVRDYPGRFAIMGSLPLDQPGSRTRIAGWRQQPGMLGLLGEADKPLVMGEALCAWWGWKRGN